MKTEINGSVVNFSTGGRQHVEGLPYLVFIHGAGQSRLTWPLQSRYFAYEGYNVIAPDLPGHGLSGGEPLATIEEQAGWLAQLLASLGVSTVHLVGHSQGGLIAIELASMQPDLVQSVAFVATAAAIPVNDALINMAETAPHEANALMVSWGSGPEAHHHHNTLPGATLIGAGIRIMELNSPGSLAADLKSCAAYTSGMEKAQALKCPTLCVFAGFDKMTPVKFGKKLAEALGNNTMEVLGDSGHMLPIERPHELNASLKGFLKRVA